MNGTIEEGSKIKQPYVMSTIHDDGSADFTVSLAEDDHKFSVAPDGDTAWVEYEESLTYRMSIRVSEPREEVWKALFQSEEMTAYLEEQGIPHARRSNH